MKRKETQNEHEIVGMIYYQPEMIVVKNFDKRFINQIVRNFPAIKYYSIFQILNFSL